MMKIVIDSGYKGFIGIEYEGGKLDEFEGIRRSQRMLQEVLAKLC